MLGGTPEIKPKLRKGFKSIKQMAKSIFDKNY